MSSKKKYFIFNNTFYYNNYINKNSSYFFFQLKLIKNFFFFFFLSISNVLYLKKVFTYIYVTQFYINSINNILIISLNLWKNEKFNNPLHKYDNYFRLKYFYSFIKKKILFICFLL